MNAAEYRHKQDGALKALIRQIRRLFLVYGVPVTVAQQEEMAFLLIKSMRNARERGHSIAAEYIAAQIAFTDIPDLSGYPLQALAKLLEEALSGFIVHGDPVTETNRKDPVVAEKSRKRFERAASRHAQAPAREIVQEVAQDTEGIGWARMLVGPTSCAFCAMLASRGPIYTSQQAATRRGEARADAYHDGCDCVAVLVVDYNTWEGRPAHNQLEDLWLDTGAKHSNKDARNAFRRAWDQKVRAGETREFLAESVRPPGGA